MGVSSKKDQEILINTLNNLHTPSAPHENMFTPSAPFLEDLECIVCMETQVIFIAILLTIIYSFISIIFI